MSFERAYRVLMVNEGGYSDHPNDRGGKTKYGISQARYPSLNIKTLTPEKAMELTKRDFWDSYRCYAFPWPISLVLFDCVFQHNPSGPIRWLQTALGVRADGVIGAITIQAANQAEDPLQVARDILCQRMIYMTQLEGWPTFRAGWTRRLFDVMIAAGETDV